VDHAPPDRQILADPPAHPATPGSGAALVVINAEPGTGPELATSLGRQQAQKQAQTSGVTRSWRPAGPQRSVPPIGVSGEPGWPTGLRWCPWLTGHRIDTYPAYVRSRRHRHQPDHRPLPGAAQRHVQARSAAGPRPPVLPTGVRPDSRCAALTRHTPASPALPPTGSRRRRPCRDQPARVTAVGEVV
jgi:hypothetical protein